MIASSLCMTMNFDHLTNVISNIKLPLSYLTTTLKRVINYKFNSLVVLILFKTLNSNICK
jgi:hypothetical protein